MSTHLDSPRPVREGEELDLDALRAYFAEHLPEAAGPVEAQQFPGGYSNLTYAVRAGGKEYVLRRPPFGANIKSAHDMGREYRILAALSKTYPPAPKPVLLCEDTAVMGAPFYLMERLRGVILRGKKPADWRMGPAEVRRLCEVFTRHFAELHEIDFEAAGLGDFRRPGSYVERQVDGWADRYYKSQTDDIPAIEETARWLKANRPADTETCLVHGDFKWDNLVLDPADYTRIAGVLDWEMATAGDPLMDLGTVLSYWMEPADASIGQVGCFLTSEPGAMSRQELAEHYGEITGRDVSNIAFYYTFALLKLAVIVQQIYYRYKQGFTRDERLAQFIMGVGMLGVKAAGVIESGRISN